MCGIAGFAALQSAPAGLAGKLNAPIRHRGPDDEGYVLFPVAGAAPLCVSGADTAAESRTDSYPYAPRRALSELADEPVTVAFGHRRLSILDLSPLGHQPMSYADGRYWITYNGEIYNYLELRAELQTLGHRFLSDTDTEVILAAYAQWGADCLRRFNGMWAFAIYDTAAHELFLARDRFGVKPLYYWVSPDATFCFGSEIKQFIGMPGWAATLNSQRAYDFLIWALLDHTDETLFEGVYQLRPGHCMTLKWPEAAPKPGSRLPTTQWYRLTPTPFRGTFDEAAAALRDHLTDAVRLRLRADVPVGSCLSGGLDSSSIVCVMNNLLREGQAAQRQKTFSACADIPRFDERSWVDNVVAATDVDAHYITPGLADLFGLSEKITWHQDEPFGSTSIYAQWNVFALAAQNDVTVMLDGQGADEQLAGYHSFFAPRFAGLLRQGRFATLWREIQAVKRLHGYSERRALEHIANMLFPESIKNQLRKMTGRNHVKSRWIDIARLRARAEDPNVHLGNYTDSILSLSHAQLTHSNLQMLLHWEDRDSMAHSIESRVPFLDYRLVEFVLGLPDEFKLAGGMTKRVLRRAMSGVIPDKIRDRVDKLGFVTPEEVWMRDENPALFRRELEKAVIDAQGILTPKILEIFDDIVAGRRPFNAMIWRAISFGQWMRIFAVDSGAAA